MATQLVMPKLSDTMKEGTVVSWLKKEGDEVQSGEVIAEIQSDKATVEFEAYTSGVLRKILVPADQTVPVGTLIGVLAEADEDISGVVPGGATPPAAAPTAEAAKKAEAPKLPEAPKRKPPAAPAKPAAADKAEKPAASAKEAQPSEPRSRPGAPPKAAPSPGAAQVKFGGRGPEMGLSEESARRLIAGALAAIEKAENRDPG